MSGEPFLRKEVLRLYRKLITTDFSMNSWDLGVPGVLVKEVTSLGDEISTRFPSGRHQIEIQIGNLNSLLPRMGQGIERLRNHNAMPSVSSLVDPVGRDKKDREFEAAMNLMLPASRGIHDALEQLLLQYASTVGMQGSLHSLVLSSAPDSYRLLERTEGKLNEIMMHTLDIDRTMFDYRYYTNPVVRKFRSLSKEKEILLNDKLQLSKIIDELSPILGADLTGTVNGMVNSIDYSLAKNNIEQSLESTNHVIESLRDVLKKQKARALVGELSDKDTLEVAKEYGGILTTSVLAYEREIALEQAQTVLERFARAGEARKVERGSHVLFDFPSARGHLSKLHRELIENLLNSSQCSRADLIRNTEAPIDAVEAAMLELERMGIVATDAIGSRYSLRVR